MELTLTNAESELLLEILEDHHRELFREIARDGSPRVQVCLEEQRSASRIGGQQVEGHAARGSDAAGLRDLRVVSNLWREHYGLILMSP